MVLLSKALLKVGPWIYYAFCWANYLLSNDSNAAQLELTVGLACFEALDDCQCALTGADMAATIDGQPISPWQAFSLNKGQRLQFGAAKHGYALILRFEVALMFLKY